MAIKAMEMIENLHNARQPHAISVLSTLNKGQGAGTVLCID